MKKALILAYDFPPYVSVGGLRPYNWYKYLSDYGVYPIVVTRQWDNKYGNDLDYIAPGSHDYIIVEKTGIGEVIRTPYEPNFANRLILKKGSSKFKLIRKAYTAFYEIIQFIFLIGPKVKLYYSAREYLKNNKVDVIVATGAPFVLFHYASKLSKTFDVPWIADYRDPWSQKSNIKKFFLYNLWNRYLEKKIVSSAYMVSTVTPFFQTQISTLVNKEFKILPNGYNSEILKLIEGITQKTDYLQIAYVGYIYEWHPIESFLRNVLKFIQENQAFKIRVNFYGVNNENFLKDLISKKYQALNEYVAIYPKTPNELLLQKLASQNLMLLFNYYYFPGTKIYDYLALKRAILFCYTNDTEANKLKEEYYPYKNYSHSECNVQERIIQETNSGYIVKDENHLQTLLKHLYDEFLQTGSIACDSINVEKYSRKYQVEQLAQIIKSIS